MSQTAVLFRQKALPNKWFQAACIAALVFVIYFYTSERSTHWDQFVRLTDAFFHGRLYLVDAPSWLELARYGEKGYVINPPAPTLFLMPWEEGMQPIKEVLQGRQGNEKVVVLIGPEGGFSRGEADLAKKQGFHLVSLGPNILRTETAAIAVLSMIGYEMQR